MNVQSKISGNGLGLRRDLADDLLGHVDSPKLSFLEISPESWLGIGGHWRKILKAAAEKYPHICRGLNSKMYSDDMLSFLGNLRLEGMIFRFHCTVNYTV